MRPKTLALMCVAVIGATAIVGCGSSSSASGGGSGGDQTLSITDITDLSGLGKASWGEDVAAGVKVGLQEVQASGVLKNVSLKLKTVDDGTDPTRAVTEFNSALRSGSSIFISGPYSPEATVLLPFVQRNDVLMMTTGTAGYNKPVTDSHYLRLTAAESQSTQFAEWLVKTKGLKRIGLIIDGSNPGFVPFEDGMLAGLHAAGVSGFAAKQVVATADTDFSSALASLKAKGVDAIALLIVPPSMGNVMLQAKQAGGFSGITFVGQEGTAANQVYAVAKGAAAGLLFPQDWIPGSEPAVSAFTSANPGQQPTQYFARAHDGIWLLAAAIASLEQKHQAIKPSTIIKAIPAASTSSVFTQHRLIAMRYPDTTGTPVLSAVYAQLTASGNVVPAK